MQTELERKTTRAEKNQRISPPAPALHRNTNSCMCARKCIPLLTCFPADPLPVSASVRAALLLKQTRLLPENRAASISGHFRTSLLQPETAPPSFVTIWPDSHPFPKSPNPSHTPCCQANGHEHTFAFPSGDFRVSPSPETDRRFMHARPDIPPHPIPPYLFPKSSGRCT